MNDSSNRGDASLLIVIVAAAFTPGNSCLQHTLIELETKQN